MLHMKAIDDAFTIREASDSLGLSEHTLRYYERIGLIHPISRWMAKIHEVLGEGKPFVTSLE